MFEEEIRVGIMTGSEKLILINLLFLGQFMRIMKFRIRKVGRPRHLFQIPEIIS